jgi:hypothetical protein
MSLTRAAEWLKSNWYIPLLLVGVVVALVFGNSPKAPDPTAPADGAGPASGDQSALRQEFERAKAKSQEHEVAAPPQKSTDTVIAEHTAKLEANPPPDESAALLSALGNLHKQKKQDYAAAARYYEQILQDYPDWPGIKGVYHQLMTCYSRLDDQGSLRLLYRKMVEVFPPESNEYQFAKDALGE